MKLVLLMIGILLFLNAGILTLITNFTLGLVFTYLAGILFVVWGILFQRINRIKPLQIFLIAGVLCLCLLIGFLAIYGNMDTVTYEEDCIIVLGAALRGETPSLPLIHRLDKAVAYHEKNPKALIVVTGGQGFQETVPEAVAMKRYLISCGVEEDCILTESNSTSTYENFLYSKEQLDKQLKKPYTIAYITNDFHIYRAGLTAKSVGFEHSAHLHGNTEWYLLTNHYFRECAAVLKVWLLGK